MTKKAIFIGIIFVVGLCFLTPYNNSYIQQNYLAFSPLPLAALFITLLLAIPFNLLLIVIHKGWELSQKELVIIWCAMSVAIVIPSKGLVSYLLPTLAAASHFATPENDWQAIFHQYIPDWFAITDKKVADLYYEGISQGDLIPWLKWIKTLLCWTPYVLGLYSMMFCLSAILRRQWVERERFTFPLVKLPVEVVTRPSNSIVSPFFKNRVMWVGASVPIAIHLLKGLHFYFPVMPSISLSFSLSPFLTERPWSAALPINATIFLSMVGVAYLLNLEVSFSLWFFYFLYKLECVIRLMLGLSLTSYHGEIGLFTKNFKGSQEIGAFLVIVAFAVWIGREHIKQVFRAAISANCRVDDKDEPIPFRWAVYGLLFSIALQVMMSNLMGMSVIVALAITLLFAVICVVLTWEVADAGAMMVISSFTPMTVLRTVPGTIYLTKKDLVVDAIQGRSFRVDLLQLLMPNILNAFKMSDSVKLNRRHLSVFIMVCILIAIPLSYYTNLSLAYTKGGNYLEGWAYQSGPRIEYEALVGLLTNPSGPNWGNLGYIIIGIVVTIFLFFMRLHFLWWPLHPIGYAMASGWCPHVLWLSIFLGWLLKFTLLKYGGLRIYRTAHPFFLGLILGEYTIGGIWIIVGLIVGRGLWMFWG
ncbi:MAG: hypothetical protein H8D67_23355 [Deltaproteobacteria bacterium]|nr:hypothetical protein [Deltaproteobacteria bacterium]